MGFNMYKCFLGKYNMSIFGPTMQGCATKPLSSSHAYILGEQFIFKFSGVLYKGRQSLPKRNKTWVITTVTRVVPFRRLLDLDKGCFSQLFLELLS